MSVWSKYWTKSREAGEMKCLDFTVMTIARSHGRALSLQWCHNGRDDVSNHQPHDCLLNRIFRRRSKKTSKLRVTGLCAGNSPVTGEFPAQMASDAENVSIWWRHHVGVCKANDSEASRVHCSLQRHHMGVTASRITGSLTLCSKAQTGNQENIKAPRYRPIIRVNSDLKWPVMRKAFPCPDIISHVFGSWFQCTSMDRCICMWSYPLGINPHSRKGMKRNAKHLWTKLLILKHSEARTKFLHL